MKRFLTVLITVILLIGITGIPLKNSVSASESSVVLLFPSQNDFISIHEDLKIRLLLEDLPSTSYRFGYSFIGSDGSSWVANWSFNYPILSLIIPAKAVKTAYDLYGSRLHLYIYEVDQYDYSIGFYQTINLIAYYSKGELNEFSDHGEYNVNTIASGYIWNIEKTGSWETTTNYCCSPSITTISYDYKASVSTLGTILKIEFSSENLPSCNFCYIKWPYIYFGRP